MPILKRDDYSGAIIFHPSPEEQEVSELKAELQSMKDDLADKLAQVDEFLLSTKEPEPED